MERSIVRGAFSIERTLNAPAARVWSAFAAADIKEKWFKGLGSVTTEHSFDFREGGREVGEGTFHDDTVHRFDAHYYDIVPEERIVYAYEMYLNGKRISVSLATIELAADGDKTFLRVTEDGVFFDGADTVETRERGTRELLDTLAAVIETVPVI